MTSFKPEADSRARVLLVDPLFHPKGGGAAVTFWAIEALSQAFQLTVLAWGDVELEIGNRLHGTTIKRDAFILRRPPRLYRWAGESLNWVDPSPWSVQRWAFMMNWANSIAPGYDAVVSTNGEMGLQVPAIQYIHYPYIGEAMQRSDAGTSARRRPWQVISGFEQERVKRNRTLANSDWTGAEYSRLYAAPSHTVYPPVPGHFPDIPWQDREDGFVCVGRFNGDKRLDQVIDTVAAMREHFPGIHLHLVGVAMPEEPGGAEYYEHLQQRAADHSDWLYLEENLTRKELVDLVSRHRYGIHAKLDEHFGIAVAELVKAGCITFTHRSGGQVEIVADERLLFDDTEEAVKRILAAITSPAEVSALRAHLQRQAGLFSAERFMDELTGHVRQFLAT